MLSYIKRAFTTELSDAAEQGDEPRVRQLLAKGWNVNARERIDGTPLMLAVKNGHRSVVKCLVEHGADVSKHLFGSTPLVEAVVAGHADIVQYLIQQGADVNAQMFGTRETALMTAAFRDQKQIVEMLLDSGADVDAQGSRFTALSAAAYGKRKEVAELLIVRGANINLGCFGYRRTAFMRAAEVGSIEIMQILYARGVDVNQGDQYRFTPLHLAAGKGYQAAVRFLLEKGADMNLRDANGRTASEAASHVNQIHKK